MIPTQCAVWCDGGCLSQGMMNKMRLTGPEVLSSGNDFVETQQPDQKVFDTKSVIYYQK